ncbi:MAG: T9SS type A sorting domain-containing protein [Candidatus Eisenbacteria bacterium]
MKKTPVAVLVAVLALAVFVSVASASGGDGAYSSRVPDPTRPALDAGDFRGAYRGTLWIFDADFSTTTDDNAGWTSVDRSGTLGQWNRWHIDTLRVAYGTYAFWCGEENICWKQPRGYGNQWTMLLSKELTGVTGIGGDTVTLEFDQRYAMERLYDYGYVDVSSDGGASFATVATYNNVGFQGAGVPVDWTHATYGHPTIDLSTYAGSDIVLQFRFESDEAYSSQSESDNPQHSVKDGAWELDNIEVKVNTVQTFIEDCEGADTWTHDDTPGSGQTGVTFTRAQYYTHFDTGRPQACDDRPAGDWMYAAVDFGGTGTMVDGEDTWLVSPPIFVSGYQNLVGQWDMWVDLPQNANDLFDLSLASSDEYTCVTTADGFEPEAPGAWYGGPFWSVWTDSWDAFAGNDWLAIRWELWNSDLPTDPHMGGVFLQRQRVGVPEPDPSTVFNTDTWNSFNDWFKDDLADAAVDTARIRIRDDQGIGTVTMLASNDYVTWTPYTCTPESPTDPEWFSVPPPITEMTPGSEIHYYYEVVDGASNVTTYPANAPDSYFEMSILPLQATTTDPGILLVDKHGRRIPSRERDFRHSSEYYYREALGIIGYDWETYDVEVPSGSIKSDGPDTSGMKYYDTMVWFAVDFDSYVMLKSDQYNLIQWLNEGDVKERNLLLTGNDISWELKSPASNQETLGFHDIYLAASYGGETYPHTGAALADTTPGLRDAAGNWTFMDHGDAQCILAGACPDPIECFDIITPASGITGNELVAEYIHGVGGGSISGAGVAFTDPIIGYQTIILGFGIEVMMDGVHGGVSNYEGPSGGYYKTGLADRVNIMGNIMGDLNARQPGYFQKQPDGIPTDVVDGGFKNALSQAYPNPFNPVTEIAYSVKETGQVTIEVYNVAGKVVRTLLDSELDAGTSNTVIWDGTNDLGEKCASGVYFYRINAPRFTESHKMVMLK